MTFDPRFSVAVGGGGFPIGKAVEGPPAFRPGFEWFSRNET